MEFLRSVEDDVGISCYVTSTPPFSGILKQRSAGLSGLFT